MTKRRVVVTGLGMVSPLGNTVSDTWAGIVEGKSGIAEIQHFDTSAFSTRFGGSVKDFDVSEYISKKEARRMDIFMQYGIAASTQAIKDSGLEVTDSNRKRIGVAVGSGIGGLGTIEENHSQLSEHGPRKITPFFVPASIINMISGHVSINFGLQGPNFSMVTACTTGTHSIGFGSRCIAYGDADVMVVGGAEMGSTPLGLAGFSAARALSTRNEDPEAASRPWDKDRDGFVLSDGAGVLVVEELEHARARGAKIYAEISGFGMSGDAYHITAPPEDGRGAAEAMANAIQDGSANIDQVDYINAHGTSTPAGDIAETLAVKSVFKDHANKLAISSTKSMTGHLLGAAGAIEAVFCVLSITDQIAPPTINLENPGEGCDLDYVPATARDIKINYALSNSFGFGGTNASLLFNRID